MADEIPAVTTPVAAPAAPVQPTGPTNPTQITRASIEPVQAPVAVQPTPVTPAPEPASETPVEPAKAETVLGDALDKTKPVEESKSVTPEPVKPEIKEPPKEEPVKTETKEGQSEEPAPPPVYDDFTLPEGITLDKERVKGFTDLLSGLETTGKLDHKLVQEFGQKAVDYHLNVMKRQVEDIGKYYQTTWERQKLDWKDTFFKDPEIGGNRSQTTLDAALNFIRTHGGTPEQQTEFRNAMETSGLGNHPAVIRLLANAGRAMSEGKPLAAQKPVQAPKSKLAAMYGPSSLTN